MKFVRDALYEYIPLSDVSKQVIDTPVFQRLRYIRQLAAAYLIYPGANHTRFEHSLGCMHLARKFFQFRNKECDEELVLAALLHDIGHGPFSHESELIFSKKGLSHEDISGKLITDSEISDCINDNGLSVERVREYAMGSGKGALIAGSLGIDRIDYLMRDSYYTGAMHGRIDYERILRTIDTDDGRLLLDEKGIEAAESLVLSRFMMFAILYQHKTVIIASAMLRKALEFAYDDGAFSVDELINMNDCECVQALRDCKSSAPLIDMIMKRKLHKPILFLRKYELPLELSEKLDDNFAASLENRICDECGLSRSEVVVHCTHSSYKPIDVRVSGRRGNADLSGISDLVSSINRASESKRVLLAAVSPESKARVQSKINAIIESLCPQQSR